MTESLTPAVIAVNKGSCSKAENKPDNGIFAHHTEDLQHISYGHGAAGLGCAPGVTNNPDGSISNEMIQYYQKVNDNYPWIGGWMGKCGEMVQVPGSDKKVLIVDQPTSGQLELSPKAHWLIFKDDISFNLCTDCECQ